MGKTKKHHKASHKKTRRAITKTYTEKMIVLMFLRMLNTVKLYHWKTFSYAQHKATDELYVSLNTHIDAFVEIMLGKTGKRVDLTGHKMIPLHDYSNVNDFRKEINNYKKFLIDMNKDDAVNITNNSDLLNLRDEMLADLNKFTYLLTLK